MQSLVVWIKAHQITFSAQTVFHFHIRVRSGNAFIERSRKLYDMKSSVLFRICHPFLELSQAVSPHFIRYIRATTPFKRWLGGVELRRNSRCARCEVPWVFHRRECSTWLKEIAFLARMALPVVYAFTANVLQNWRHGRMSLGTSLVSLIRL